MPKTPMPALSTLLRSLVVVAVTLFAAGCFHLESIEERQVKSDYERKRRGEPLVHHRDSFELSEHAMKLRLGKRGGAQPLPIHDNEDPRAGSPPPVISPAGNKQLDVYGESQPAWNAPPGPGYPGAPAGAAGKTALGNSSWSPPRTQ